MRKLSFLLISFAIVGFASPTFAAQSILGGAGDLTISTKTTDGGALLLNTRRTGTGIYINTSNNIGIGTTTPQGKLHISGGALHIDNNQLLVFRNAAGTGIAADIVSSSSDDLRLRTATSERITILSGGNVGIGTTEPGHLLHVLGSTDWAGRFQNGNGADVRLAYQGGHGIFIDSSVVTSSAYLLHLNSNSQSRFIVQNNGNIGIGVASPASPLDVRGNIANEPTLRIQQLNSDGHGVYIIGGSNTSSNHALRIDSTTSTGLLYVRNDGNIGIGTTAPGAKLEVNGNIIASAPTASDHVATRGWVEAQTGGAQTKIGYTFGGTTVSCPSGYVINKCVYAASSDLSNNVGYASQAYSGHFVSGSGACRNSGFTSPIGQSSWTVSSSYPDSTVVIAECILQ